MNNAKENSSTKTLPKEQRIETTDERAQYEVFRNGDLPRETIEKWIEADLRAIMSLVSGMLNDPEIRGPVVDAYYSRYKKLHTNDEEAAN